MISAVKNETETFEDGMQITPQEPHRINYYYKKTAIYIISNLVYYY